jgi:hypothetical protein
MVGVQEALRLSIPRVIAISQRWSEPVGRPGGFGAYVVKPTRGGVSVPPDRLITGDYGLSLG